MGALNSFNLKHKFVKATRLTYTGETQDQSLGQEDPLGKGMATHSSFFFFFFLSSILALRIPQTEEPGRIQFMGSERIVHD